MIYEIMNSGEFINTSTSFIVGLELADEFVADLYDNEPENLFYEYDEQEIEDTLNSNEFFVVSRNYYSNGEAEYFLEPLLHEGVQYSIGSDYIFIEDDLLDVVDFSKLEEGEILSFTIEEDCEEEWADEEECECEWCSGFDIGYDQGYNKAIEEMLDFLNR